MSATKTAKIRVPAWADPHKAVTDEELRFACEAEDVIDFLNRGLTREQHVACFKKEYQEQGGKDWDETVRRLAEEAKTR